MSWLRKIMKSDRKRRSYKEYSLNDRLHGEQFNIGLRPLGDDEGRGYIY